MASNTHTTRIRRSRRHFLLASAASLLVACQSGPPNNEGGSNGQLPSSPTSTPPPVIVSPTATVTVAIDFTGEVAHFRRKAFEWKEAIGGDYWDTRGTGYVVHLRRLEGRRWLVWDPQTNGPCYVDRADLTISAEAERKVATLIVPVRKSVVGLVAQPERYQQAEVALRSLGGWLKLTARPDDRYTFLWTAPLSTGKAAEIIPPLILPSPPAAPRLATPTPLPPHCIFDQACRDVIEAEEARYAADLADYDRSVHGHKSRLRSLIDAAEQGLVGALAGPRPPQGDLGDAVSRAVSLLDKAPGERWLLIASPLEAPPVSIHGLPSIEGFQIRFVFPEAAGTALFHQHAAGWMRWAADRRAGLHVVDASADLTHELF